MSAILIVNEIQSERQSLARALEAEGFAVVEADSPSAAVREIWEGTFIVALIASTLAGTSGQALGDQLKQMAPEIETIVVSKNDDTAEIVRKSIDIRDGEAAA